MYASCFKRPLDFILSLAAILVLSPVLLILTAVGAVCMGGNPFFVQPRPGKKDKNGQEKIFKLIKFRSMNNRKNGDGNLLPDEQRLTKYGRFIRSTSLDELPELFNILMGDLSIVGPRPLLVEYLPYYTEEERHRHDIRPGLTGWAQVNGRTNISWDQKLAYDVEYVSHITFVQDVKVLLLTVQKVFKRADIAVGADFKGGKFIDQRKEHKYNAILATRGEKVNVHK